MPTRRQFGFGAISGAMARPLGAAPASKGVWPPELASWFAKIEVRCGGRLGVCALDTQTGDLAGHRLNERFPMCSIYKALCTAALLAKVDQGHERLDRRVFFEVDKVLPYSPRTEAQAGTKGMTVASLCEAAVTFSDNTAANLILDLVGGPAGLTAYLRGINDTVTRLDRNEPALNEALPGDPRDTATPLAIVTDLDRLVLGDALLPASRELLSTWLVNGKTGAARLRAGVPQGWRIGEKTGTGARGTTNDVGLIWPPGRDPVIVAVFITETSKTLDDLNANVAEVARIIAASLPA